MTTEEKNIEKAAEYYSNIIESISMQSFNKIQCADDYIAGVKSEAAKEYWQKGMYSEDEVIELLSKMDYCGWVGNFAGPDVRKEWFEQNKKK